MVSLSFSHVKLVLEALAHFHGSWWQLLNAEGAFRLDTFSSEYYVSCTA